MDKFSYVLVTAARNEAKYITNTIESVISQTILPKKWVIVSDSSTDQTDEIVNSYAKKHNFIVLVHIKTDVRRNFASKANAIEAGYIRMRGVEYDFLGILDADTSFGPNYYECIIQQFQQNAKLGIAGGLISDVYGEKCVPWLTRLDSSVGGPIQMFRRKCYEDIGGLRAQKNGGEDAVAEFMCRMHGWEVETFPAVKVYHHRRMGTANQSIWRARFILGERDYLIGYLPFFEALKCVRRIIERPYFIGSFLWLSGYLWAALRRYKRTVPLDIVKYIRKEQGQLLLKPFLIFRKEKGA